MAEPLSVGDIAIYKFTGEEWYSEPPPFGVWPPAAPASGLERPATILRTYLDGSTRHYIIKPIVQYEDAHQMAAAQLEFDCVINDTPTAGGISPVVSGQPLSTAAIAAIAAVTSTAGQVAVQNSSGSASITAGAAAAVLATDSDRALETDKAVLCAASLSVSNSSLLTTATVTVKLQKSEDAGSNWTDLVTKVYALTGAIGALIPSVASPAIQAAATRAAAGNVRTRLTVSCTGANVSVSEWGFTTRWAETPN